MDSEVSRFEQRAAWLGYLGILPFVIGVTLLLDNTYAEMALAGVTNYAAIILTFVGAIHWGRAMTTGKPGLLVVSVAPSLIAWGSLFLATRFALPIMISGFLLLLVFDYREYRDIDWFRRLRTHLTLSVSSLLLIAWLITL